MQRRKFLLASSSIVVAPLLKLTSEESSERSLLLDFCSNTELRYNLKTPFVVNGYIYATDGCAAIRMLKGDFDIECNDNRTRLGMEGMFLESMGALEDQFWFDFKLATFDQLETDGSANYVGDCPLCTYRSFQLGSVEKHCDLCNLKPYRGGDLQRIDRCLIRYRDALRISKIPGIKVSVRQQRHSGPGTVRQLYSTPVIFRGDNNIDGVIGAVPIPVPYVQPVTIRYESKASAEPAFSSDFGDFDDYLSEKSLGESI